MESIKQEPLVFSINTEAGSRPLNGLVCKDSIFFLKKKENHWIARGKIWFSIISGGTKCCPSLSLYSIINIHFFCLFLHRELKHHLSFLQGWINKIGCDMTWLINETGVFSGPYVLFLNFRDGKIILTFNILEANWVKQNSSLTFNNNATQIHSNICWTNWLHPRWYCPLKNNNLKSRSENTWSLEDKWEGGKSRTLNIIIGFLALFLIQI